MLVTKFGASPAVVSSVGVIAVHLAAASGHESTVRLLHMSDCCSGLLLNRRLAGAVGESIDSPVRRGPLSGRSASCPWSS